MLKFRALRNYLELLHLLGITNDVNGRDHAAKAVVFRIVLYENVEGPVRKNTFVQGSVRFVLF